MSHQPQPSDIPDLTCPFTCDVMDEPVTASDGNVYEKSWILEHFARHGANATSPLTREPFAHRNLTPCVETAAITRVWREYLGENPHLSLAGANAAGAVQVAEFQMPTVASPLLDNMQRKHKHLNALGMGGIKRQCIMVLGHQGVGKSTTLERVVGIPIFPRHAKRTGEPCTRMVVCMITNRGAWEAPTMRVVSAADAASLSARTTASEGWRRAPVGFPLDRMPEVVRDIMASVAGDAPFVTDKVLQIKITAPHLPQMVFIDVPGLPGEDVTGAADARQLIIDTIERHKETSTFLWVNDILSHRDNSSVGKLIRDCGIEAQTTGVMTQVDRLTGHDDEETKAEAFAQAFAQRCTPAQVQAGLGWFAVSNQSLMKRAARMRDEAEGKGCLEQFRLLAMKNAEATLKAELLRDAEPDEVRLINEHYGDDVLRRHLVRTAESFCVEHWIPQLRATIFEQLATGYGNLIRGGLPMACPANVIESANRADMAAAVDARAPSIVQSFAKHEAAVAGRGADEIVDRVVERTQRAADGLRRSDIPVVAKAIDVLAKALADLERDMTQDFAPDADVPAARKKSEFEKRLRKAVDTFCGSLSAGFGAASSASTARKLIEIAVGKDEAADRQSMTTDALEDEVNSADAPFALRRFSALQKELVSSVADAFAGLKATFDEESAAVRAVMSPQQFEVVRNEADSRLAIKPKCAKTLTTDPYVSDFVLGNFLLRLCDAADEATACLSVSATRDPRVLREDAEATRVEQIADIAQLWQVLRVIDEAV